MPIIQSVQRALQILDLFNEHDRELKITEISARIGLHKSTVHSLLKTLQESDYIQQNSENGKYRLGMKLAERGNVMIGTLDIRQIARRYLIEISQQTGQTTHLGILEGQAGVYIDKVEGELALIRYSRIGRRIPLHSTAIGKVLLADQPHEKVRQLLTGYEYTRLTDYTIQSEADFFVELEKVRQQGYGVDNQENEQGVRCIAIPIKNERNQVLAALSLSTLVSRVDDQQLLEYIHLLKQTGQRLSQQLRYVE